jgi:hypothetical protein
LVGKVGKVGVAARICPLICAPKSEIASVLCFTATLSLTQPTDASETHHHARSTQRLASRPVWYPAIAQALIPVRRAAVEEQVFLVINNQVSIQSVVHLIRRKVKEGFYIPRH